jgi:hypothetical protein
LVAPGGDGSGGAGDLLYQYLSCTSALDCTNFTYKEVSGTSISAALVSASAALVISSGADLPDSVGRYLMLGATDLGGPGYDSDFGWGRVTPMNAFSFATSAPPHPNGVLVKTASKPEVYLLENGQKRLIPNPSVFVSRFNWSEVFMVSNYEMDSYPQGSNLGYPDGRLLKGSGSPVYVISNDQKRFITSPRVFVGLGYKWETVISVLDSELSYYSDGSDIDSTVQYPDGSLVKATDRSEVYLIDRGQKRFVPSTAIFSSRYQWENVLVSSNPQLNAYTQGPDITFRDGSLIKGSGFEVYVVTTTTGSTTQSKRFIYSPLTFLGVGFRWENLRTVSDSTLQSFPDGPTIY